jgi:transposase
LFNTENALSNANFDINKVKQTLTSVYDSVDLTDSDQIKDADKTAFIDLNDPFKSSKLVFDFGTVEEEILESQTEASEVVKKKLSTKDKKGKDKSEQNKC